MAIFEQEHFGKVISDKLSMYLKQYTSNEDVKDISSSTSVGTSTIQKVRDRDRNLTECNSEAIVQLMRVAIQNANKYRREATKAINYLKKRVA